jgi:hypothetical protein
MGWENWEDARTATVWNEALEALIQVCKEFAEDKRPERDIQVSARHWDSPDVVLEWVSAGLHRNLQLLLDKQEWPLQVHFTGVVWNDPEGDPNQRDVRPPMGLGRIPFTSAAKAKTECWQSIAQAFQAVDSFHLHMTASGAGRARY